MPKKDELQKNIDQLKEEISDYETKIKAKEIEIRSKKEKINKLTQELNEITKELNELKTINSVNITILENSRLKIISLEEQIENKEKEKNSLEKTHLKMMEDFDRLSNSYSTLSKTIETLSNNLSENKKKLTEKENKNSEMEIKIKDQNEMILRFSKEKEELLKEKITNKENLMDEKMEMSKKISELEHSIEDYKDKIKKLRTRAKTSSDGLLGHSMEIEALKKKIDEKDKEIEKIEGILTGETGFFGEMNTLMEYVDNKFKEIKRSVRMVLPDISYLEEYNLLSLIKDLSGKIVINLAIPLTQDLNKKIIEELKEKDANVVNTSEKNIFALAIDGSNIALGVTSGKQVRGIYTTILELVHLFNAALMQPFIKGVRV
ncbi:MAG: hypothetical protein ACTSWY_10735 [Promethearchaeota archaeon]